MTITPKQSLVREVGRFRQWAEAEADSAGIRVDELQGEWEFSYDEWWSLYRAVFDVLDVVPSSWDEETSELLLFALARDNEAERIADELTSRPEAMLKLARKSLPSTEDQAKWQIAAYLPGLDDSHDEVRSLLNAFCEDGDEYVRRRALMSVGIVGSSALEPLVDKAWATGDEYQRMAALTALRDGRSPRLNDFLLQAESDGREYLVACAVRIRAGKDPRKLG